MNANNKSMNIKPKEDLKDVKENRMRRNQS